MTFISASIISLFICHIKLKRRHRYKALIRFSYVRFRLVLAVVYFSRHIIIDVAIFFNFLKSVQIVTMADG